MSKLARGDYMILSKNGMYLSDVTPEYVGKKIVIAIDSSKSNTGMVVGDCEGHVLDDYEINGSGGDVDVYDLCRDTRKFLKVLFDGADIQRVGIEDIITKKEGNYKGLDVHQSRAKITAIFNNFIFAFEEYFGIRPKPISNQSWKAGVLPEEYRRRTHHKGSKDWFDDIGNRWAGRKDDVTDAVCIYIYMMKTETIEVVYDVKETRPATSKYDYMIMPVAFRDVKNFKKFQILNGDTLEHNIATISTMLKDNEYGYFYTDISNLSIDLIYSSKLCYSGMSQYGREDKEVVIVVQRL